MSGRLHLAGCRCACRPGSWEAEMASHSCHHAAGTAGEGRWCMEPTMGRHVVLLLLLLLVGCLLGCASCRSRVVLGASLLGGLASCS